MESPTIITSRTRGSFLWSSLPFSTEKMQIEDVQRADRSDWTSAMSSQKVHIAAKRLCKRSEKEKTNPNREQSFPYRYAVVAERGGGKRSRSRAALLPAPSARARCPGHGLFDRLKFIGKPGWESRQMWTKELRVLGHHGCRYPTALLMRKVPFAVIGGRNILVFRTSSFYNSVTNLRDCQLGLDFRNSRWSGLGKSECSLCHEERSHVPRSDMSFRPCRTTGCNSSFRVSD